MACERMQSTGRKLGVECATFTKWQRDRHTQSGESGALKCHGEQELLAEQIWLSTQLEAEVTGWHVSLVSSLIQARYTNSCLYTKGKVASRVSKGMSVDAGLHEGLAWLVDNAASCP